MARNEGNIGATVVVGDDTLDTNSTLVVGSVQTTQGMVNTGTLVTPTSRRRSARCPVARVRRSQCLRVRINNPLPAGVTSVSNQALVSAANVASVVTDDPDTAELDDATTTSLVATPVLEFTKQDALLVDADNNDIASPGDTIQYTVVVRNYGNQAATGVQFADSPDTNTTLVAGSVRTSQGNVINGNAAGDTSARVALGTLAGNRGAATITFRVRINAPLPAGVTTIRNQGTITAANATGTVTDDPYGGNRRPDGGQHQRRASAPIHQALFAVRGRRQRRATVARGHVPVHRRSPQRRQPGRHGRCPRR